jgi:hypothetical protein
VDECKPLPMSPTRVVTLPLRSTPLPSSHTTHSHSGMSVTCASTRYTCGEFTKLMICTGFRSAGAYAACLLHLNLSILEASSGVT